MRSGKRARSDCAKIKASGLGVQGVVEVDQVHGCGDGDAVVQAVVIRQARPPGGA